MTAPFDVAVLGPGPAGSACAMNIARAGRRVVLIGPVADAPHRSGEIIGPSARRQLATADELSGIPIRFVASGWAGGGPDIRDLQLLTGRTAVTAARPSLDKKLLAQACGAGACHIAARVRACLRDGAVWHIHLAGITAPLTASFVVEATGRGARSTAVADAGRHYLDRLVVLWCLVTTTGADDDTLHLAACAHGWWYLVPNGTGRSFLAFATDADLLPPTGRADFFERCAVGTDFGAHVRRRSTQLQIIEARTSIRTPQSAPGWIAIGDAAFSLDPLSGDGVSRALSDGIEIARSLTVQRAPIDTALELRDVAAGRMRRIMQLLSERGTHYTAVTRWPESPFWSRRRCADPLAVLA